MFTVPGSQEQQEEKEKENKNAAESPRASATNLTILSPRKSSSQKVQF
jgi:hypothetical protein